MSDQKQDRHISQAARLGASLVLNRLRAEGHIDVHDYGGGGRCLCETIIEHAMQDAIDEAIDEKCTECDAPDETSRAGRGYREIGLRVRDRHLDLYDIDSGMSLAGQVAVDVSDAVNATPTATVTLRIKDDGGEDNQ